MKKVLITIFFLLLSFVGIDKANASAVSWERKCKYDANVNFDGANYEYSFQFLVYKSKDGSGYYIGDINSPNANVAYTTNHLNQTVINRKFERDLYKKIVKQNVACPLYAFATACKSNNYKLTRDESIADKTICAGANIGGGSGVNCSDEIYFSNDLSISSTTTTKDCKNVIFRVTDTLGADVVLDPHDPNEVLPQDVICPFCIETAAAWKFIGVLLFFLKILVPVILIIFASIDLGKTVISNDTDSINKSIMVIVQRIVLGIIIFFIPSIINITLALINNFSEVENMFIKCTHCLLSPFSNECENNINENKTCVANASSNNNSGGTN